VYSLYLNEIDCFYLYFKKEEKIKMFSFAGIICNVDSLSAEGFNEVFPTNGWKRIPFNNDDNIKELKNEKNPLLEKELLEKLKLHEWQI
jgi:hypothetical protein